MRRLLLRIGPSRRGRRLDDVLGEWLPQALERPLSRSALRQLVMAGAVRLDGQVVRRPALSLPAGAYVGRAAREGVLGAKTGAVTAVQRTSSDMRLHEQS